MKKTQIVPPRRKVLRRRKGKEDLGFVIIRRVVFGSIATYIKFIPMTLTKSLLVGRRHRTHNGLEKEYYVNIEIPDLKSYDYLYTIDIKCTKGKPKHAILGALKEIYGIVGLKKYLE